VEQKYLRWQKAVVNKLFNAPLFSPQTHYFVL
jgi:hypothetical protein